MRRLLIPVILLLGRGYSLQAQALPAATRAGDLKIGGGVSSAASDYGQRFNGGAAYFDFDFLPSVGLTGEFHFVDGTSGLYEKTYEVGGRYFRTYGPFVPYAKILYGRGVFNFPPFPDGFQANYAYNLAAIGGGADYKVTSYLYVRADWEYQRWFSFQGSSLSPNLLTLGAAYHFK